MVCESIPFLLIGTGIADGAQAADAVDGALKVKQEIAGSREGVVGAWRLSFYCKP